MPLKQHYVLTMRPRLARRGVEDVAQHPRGPGQRRGV